MKQRLLKLTAIFLIFSVFNACNSESYMDISSFIRLYNKAGGESLTLSDFVLKKQENENIYCTFFPEESPAVLLKITSDSSNIISSTEIYMPKTDEKGNTIALRTETLTLFIEKCRNALISYAFISEEDAEQILSEMLLYSKSSYKNTGELTKTYGNYHFVYYSTALSSEFVITNTQIKEIEETNKPESRPLFGSTTNIRTETVPLE